jgi:hypothetical protein
MEVSTGVPSLGSDHYFEVAGVVVFCAIAAQTSNLRFHAAFAAVAVVYESWLFVRCFFSSADEAGRTVKES